MKCRLAGAGCPFHPYIAILGVYKGGGQLSCEELCRQESIALPSTQLCKVPTVHRAFNIETVFIFLKYSSWGWWAGLLNW